MSCPQCSYPAAPGQTACQNCGYSFVPVPAGGYLAPLGFGMPVQQPVAVGSLSLATAWVFGAVALVSIVDAGLRIGNISVSVAAAVPVVLIRIAIIPLFIVWFYKVRGNAGLWAPQRRAKGWAIGAWFTPIVFLWFPFQIAMDAWAASMPAGAPNRGPAIVRAWWACWLLAWFTGFHEIHTVGAGPNGPITTTNFTLTLGGTTVSLLFSVLAAGFAAIMVLRVGRAQEARRDGLFSLR